jgi:hypothetical protein
MASWIDAYDTYLNDVPGCTYTVAAHQLRKAAQVFCEQTRAWRVDLDPVLTMANLVEYEYDLSSEQEIVRVLSVKMNGEPMPIVLEGQQNGYSSGFIPRGPFRFQIFPAPAKGQKIEIRAAIEPSNTASGLDREIYRKYINIIAQGAKAELFGMSNQPFSNPAAALIARRAFEDGISKTLADLATQYSSGRQRVVASFM